MEKVILKTKWVPFSFLALVSVFLFISNTHKNKTQKNSLPAGSTKNTLDESKRKIPLRDFRVGLCIGENELAPYNASPMRYSNWSSFSSTWSPWISGKNCFTPNAFRLRLQIDQLPGSFQKDFRIGFQAAENCGSNNTGKIIWTRWASEDISLTDLITNANTKKPDAFRIIVETRPWNSSKILVDFRLGIKPIINGEAGETQYTPFVSEGAGYANWVSNQQSNQTEGFKIFMEPVFDN